MKRAVFRLLSGAGMLLPFAGRLLAVEIHEAVLRGSAADVERLLKSNPELIAASDKEYWGPPLYWAASVGNKDMIELLLAHHAEVNGPSQDGWTPLHSAVGNFGKAAVEILLQHGANVNVIGPTGMTPLHSAVARRGSAEIVGLLLKAGANVNARRVSGATPLMEAAQVNGNKETVALLLAHGADVDAVGGYSDGTALMSAAHCPDPRSLEVLIQAKAKLDLQTANGYTALYLAARDGHAKNVEILLASGASFDLEDARGMTALGLCRRSPGDARLSAVAEVLSKAGATQTGSLVRTTNIQSAALLGDSKRVKILLRANPSLANDREKKGGDPVLCKAVASGDRATVQALLDAGADTNVGDRSGYAPLHMAAQHGAVEIATLLLEKGAQVNGRDQEGRTAVFSGNVRMIELLIAHGADVSIRNQAGATPLDLATTLNQHSAAEALRRKGAK